LDRSGPEGFSDDERAIIEEEERFLIAARTAIESVDERNIDKGVQQRMISLRSELSEALTDDLASIAAEAQRVRSTAAIRERVQLPDLEQPYFAHMQLESDRGVRDVFLGQCTFIDAARGISIVDWRAAPVAQIFFHYAEGEEYEQEYPDRWVEGVVLKRRVLAFDDGELVQIQAPTSSLRRAADGQWMRDPLGQPPRLEGGEGGALAKRAIGTGLSGLKLPVISSLLDQQQYEALTRDADRPLLILGGAGCGKTTVALHRVAHLVYQRPDLYAPSRLIVIVPEEGLLRLTKSLLEELGMEDVCVTTVDDWFVEQGQALFPELPSKLSVSTPAAILRLKRHSALCAQLERIAEDAGRDCAQEIDRLLRTGSEFTVHYENSQATYPLQRLEAAHRAICEGQSAVAVDARSSIVKLEMARFASSLGDRERLLGDRAIIEEVVRAADGEIPESTIERSMDWFRLQFATTADEEYADVDARRRRALDGLSLDAGTPSEDAGSIDVEDYALLLELNRRKTGRSISMQGSLQAYAHMVLDEAQELSEVELRVLGQAVAERGCVTVAGDPAQQIGTGSRFSSWDELMAALGQGNANPVTLETSYRCTRPIVEFGHAVLGPLATGPSPFAPRDGAPVSKSRVSSDMHAAIVLAEALSDLLEREAMAQVAIITREDETAAKLHAALHLQLPVRLVLDGRFSFKPGIDITSIPQVKGLEFDYVVIPDATDDEYPTDAASRRMLHVAATRAIHQLWIMTTGEWSRLLPN
jgi:DNA helicase-2/ATP-dependent DNA helicase PcrA